MESGQVKEENDTQQKCYRYD